MHQEDGPEDDLMSGSFRQLRLDEEKKRRRRSMCQKDHSRHGVCSRQKDNVADIRKTHRELDKSGLEEDTDGCRRTHTQNQSADARVHHSTQDPRRGRRKGTSLIKAKSFYTLFCTDTYMVNM